MRLNHSNHSVSSSPRSPLSSVALAKEERLRLKSLLLSAFRVFRIFRGLNSPALFWLRIRRAVPPRVPFRVGSEAIAPRKIKARKRRLIVHISVNVRH